jgi:formylmethanofuran dehydrogenase subunit C
MMKGGTIEIHGNAGDYLAAPYRGSTKGMHGGKIVVHGNVGSEVGACMKKGTIKVCGNTGQFVGIRMHEGTIYVQGNCDERAGACMTDGKIIVGGKLQSILPTFTVESIRPRVKVDENETAQGPFYLFLGDLAECGKGKLYVSKQKNPQLGSYGRFL